MQDELEPGQEVQHFAFGGIANPSQSPFLRGSDREYLEARQKELDEFEKQRLAYNDALTKWQTEVYNPYKAQVDAYNTAASKYNTDVYNPYKSQVDAYNAALQKYNEEVYNPYAKQYAEYEKAVNAWNAGSRESDYAGPAAPTLARNFDMTLPTQPKAFEMTAPTAPEDFSMAAPVLPFKEEDVIKYQQEAAARARKDAGNRAVAIDVVSNPDQFNFGSMSVSNRFMAEGGPVSKSRKDLDSLMRLAEGGSTTKEIRDWWAANEGKGTQADLDRWLATSGYTAAQMNEALPQFGVADLNSAIKRAQSQQEVADREARREALRQQNPGQSMIISGGGPSEPAAPAVNRISAVPKGEMDTARAQLDAQTANYMDWYLNQMNPLLNKRNIDIVNAQGVNPYADANALRGAQEAMQRAQGRQSLGTGYTPEWSDPNWREKQTAREAQQAAENARRAQEAQNSIFTTGPGNRTVIGGSVPAGSAGPARTNAPALIPAANWSASPSYSGATATGVQSYSGPNPLDMTAFLKSMPGANWGSSGTGSGPRTTDQAAVSTTSGGFGQGSNIPYQTATNAGQVGGIGTAINLVGPAMPGIGAFGPVGTAAQQSLATRPSNFFAQSQGAFQGMTPGTVSAPYNPMEQYQGPSPLVALAYNPNLSPGMLGGMQNAGMMTDRLGNRIYAPATPPFGFAKGGQVDLDAMRALVDASNVADEEDGPTVDEYAGEAKRMLASIQPSGQTQKMSRTRLPATGGGADTPKEMGMQADALTTPADYKPKKAKSAQAELRALAKQYALKQRAAENQARGLMQNTLGAPTLEQPTLTRDSLSVKRFQKGGEAKKAEGGKASQSASRGLPAPSLMNATLWADTVSRDMYPSDREYVKRDAARHLLAAAIMANKTSPGMAEFLGKAHEFKEAPFRTTGYFLGLSKPRADYPTDVHNNALGASMHRLAGDPEKLEQAVRDAIRQGSVRIEAGRVALTPDDLPGMGYGEGLEPGVAVSQKRMQKRMQEGDKRGEKASEFKHGGAVKRRA